MSAGRHELLAQSLRRLAADLLRHLPADAQLLIDDSHGVGVLGRSGRGVVELFALDDPRIILTGSLAKALGSAGVDFEYLEFGSYTSQWKERLAIKIWSGYPTYPQVFVDGVLIGGFAELRRSLDAGTLRPA